MKPLAHIDAIRTILDYNPLTGEFIWLKSRGGRKKGSVAGHTQAFSNGTCWYYTIRVFDRLYLAHRLAWALSTGKWPVDMVDHKNGNTLDNRFENLREATQVQNMHNKAKCKHNKSGYKGVSWDKFTSRYVARIQEPGGKYRNLGRFDDPEQAHRAYVAAATEMFKEFARAA